MSSGQVTEQKCLSGGWRHKPLLWAGWALIRRAEAAVAEMVLGVF